MKQVDLLSVCDGIVHGINQLYRNMILKYHVPKSCEDSDLSFKQKCINLMFIDVQKKISEKCSPEVVYLFADLLCLFLPGISEVFPME